MFFYSVFMIKYSMKKRRRFCKGYKNLAINFTDNRIKHFNSFYNFEISKVRIKNQKSRWGSCSSKKNLNFNYKVIFLRPELADYLIVHELCHLGELNHSKKFWALVQKIIPNYKKISRELRSTPINIVFEA